VSNIATKIQPTLPVAADGTPVAPPAAIVASVSKALSVGVPATADLSIDTGLTFLLDFLTVHCDGLTVPGASITVDVSYKYPTAGAVFTTLIDTITGVVSSTGMFDFYLDLDDYRLGEGIGLAFSLLNITVTVAAGAVGGMAHFAIGVFGPITEN